MPRYYKVKLWLAGALATLALPPVGFVPALLPGLWYLLLCVRQSPRLWTALAAGWWFAFGLYVVSLYWISNALLVEAQTFAWLIPFAVLLIPAYLALYPAAACGVVYYAAPRSYALSAVLLASLLALGEWLRSTYVLPFAFTLLGSTWHKVLPVAQVLSVVGIYGLTFLTVALLALLTAPTWRPRLLSVAALLLLAAWGQHRLQQPPADSGVLVRLVQPNIAQRMKWDAAAAEANWQSLLDLSREQAEDRPSLVLWPESATPFPLSGMPERRKEAASILDRGQYLVTGSNWYVLDNSQQEYTDVYNSAVVLSSDSRVADRYDKYLLVPFGEYVPLRRLLPPFAQALTGKDFSRGTGAQTILLPETAPFSPLICYEGTFAGRVVAPGQRPEWLLNITNDAWFGQTAGAWQHLALTSLRSIEEGLPLVRVANTGISAVIDAHGRVRQQLGLGRRGILDAALPDALPPTPYSRYGNTPVLRVLLLITVAGVAIGLWQRRQ